MKPPRDRTIDVRGLKIHYLEWGEPDGEPLLLIHGFLDHARSWEPLVAELEKKSSKPRWIVAPDCRGHGDSGWVGAGGYYHFPDYLWDLECLLESLDVEKISLIGHSMGGTISFLYAGTFPEKVRKLVLVEGIGPIAMRFVDTPPRMERWLAELKGLRQRKVVEYATLEEAAKRLRRKNPRLKPKLALELASSGMKQIESGKWVWKFDPLHRTVAPQPFYAGQAVEFFRRIQCPVLIVNGAKSRQTPRPDLEERLSAIADRSHAEIEDAGHMVHHDNPEGLAQAVTAFLNRVSRPLT
jgi:pimeloyl-ACP methyl ester carboxylesterase